MHEYGCSATEVNADYIIKCILSIRDQLGIAIIGPITGAVNKIEIDTLKSID